MPPALQTPTRDSSFASTRWTVVRQAVDSQTASQHALSALAELCQFIGDQFTFSWLHRLTSTPSQAVYFKGKLYNMGVIAATLQKCFMNSSQRNDDGEYFYGVLPPPSQSGNGTSSLPVDD